MMSPLADAGPILYDRGYIVADRYANQAYLCGVDKDKRLYVVSIGYAERPAPLTLYYTDPLHDIPDYTPVLTPEGNLLIAGGLTTAVSNFAPSAHAYVLRIGDGTADLSESNHLWWWLAALAAATVVAVGFLVRKYRRHKAFRLAEASAEVTAIGSTESTTELMQRINELMERKKLYLDSELKVSDIAHAFKLHRNDISACINSQTGCTFTQYVNRYRVDYAKQLLRQQPEKKISTVWTEAGFGTEQTFFKIFRAATGVSPKEWAAQCNNLSENAKID